MKRWFRISKRTGLILAMTCAPSLAFAGKYAVVDMQAIILNVEDGKKAKTDLEKEIKAKEAELLKKKEELDKLNKDWQGQVALMSEEARSTKQKEFQEKFMSFRNEELSFKEEIKRKEQKATQAIIIKVAGIVERLAKERGFEAVFETNTAGLLYLSSPVDLTKSVIEKYAQEPKQKLAKQDKPAKKESGEEGSDKKEEKK